MAGGYRPGFAHHRLMRCLIDSHILFWAAHKSPKLPELYAGIIASPSNTIYFSVVTLWELAIKRTIGKLVFEDGFLKDAGESGYTMLPVSTADLLAYSHLPLHHRDPFDRMMVAQAKSHGMTLLTADEKIRQQYGNIITLL
jgi:PIN domain nuclease of toxin-antitoxin system